MADNQATKDLRARVRRGVEGPDSPPGPGEGPGDDDEPKAAPPEKPGFDFFKKPAEKKPDAFFTPDDDGKPQRPKQKTGVDAGELGSKWTDTFK
jgi:hypothetical protein